MIGRDCLTDQQRIRVLVADHDRWTRHSVSDILVEAGFAVAEASNGMAVLRGAAVDPPRIVLLGSALPEISTADVVRALRNDPRMRHTAVVEVRNLANPIELLATVLRALHARNEGRVHERPQTGTRQAIPVSRVAPTLAPASIAGARLSKRLCSALSRPVMQTACPPLPEVETVRTLG